jgi:hypothetical protein
MPNSELSNLVGKFLDILHAVYHNATTASHGANENVASDGLNGGEMLLRRQPDHEGETSNNESQRILLHRAE